MRDDLPKRRERRTRRVVRSLQLAVVLLAAATGVLACREATRPPAVAPGVLLPAPKVESEARLKAAARQALALSAARVVALGEERARRVAEVAHLSDRIRAFEVPIAALGQMLSDQGQAAERQAARLARERQRNPRLWLRRQRAEAGFASVRAAHDSPGWQATAPATAGSAAAEPALPEARAILSASVGGDTTGSARALIGAPVAPAKVAAEVQAYRLGDDHPALEMWRPLAESGNAKAQFHLGALLFEGRVEPRGDVAADAWLERAEGNGHRSAVELRGKVGALRDREGLQRAQEGVAS